MTCLLYDPLYRTSVYGTSGGFIVTMTDEALYENYPLVQDATARPKVMMVPPAKRDFTLYQQDGWMPRTQTVRLDYHRVGRWWFYAKHLGEFGENTWVCTPPEQIRP